MAGKKRALVLSGGGFKGAFQLGAIRYLRESWGDLFGDVPPLRFDIIAGVSVGALNGAMVATGRFRDLESLWNDVKANGGKEIYESAYINNNGKVSLHFDTLRKSLLPNFRLNAGLVAKGLWNAARHKFDKRVPGLIETLLKAAEKEFEANFPRFKSLANNIPLEKKLKQYIDLARIPAGMTYLCGLVSIADGRYYGLDQHSFTDNRDFVKAILASSAMPIIWEPVEEIRTSRYGLIGNAVDGGIRNISPLADVIDHINVDPDEAEYEVIIVNCNSGFISPLKKQWNIGDIALRALTEITLAELFNNDVNEFLKVNALVEQAYGKDLVLRHKGKPLKRFAYTLIQPRGNELGDTLDSTGQLLLIREELGYQAARKAFESRG